MSESRAVATQGPERIRQAGEARADQGGPGRRVARSYNIRKIPCTSVEPLPLALSDFPLVLVFPLPTHVQRVEVERRSRNNDTSSTTRFTGSHVLPNPPE
jgi:hypothetical protein